MNKPLVYVAGPFRGPDHYAIHKNILAAEDISWHVWAMGGVALCPHLNTQHFQGSLPDDIWLEGDIIMLKRCDVVLMMPRWRDSSGATEEHRVAIEAKIPVVYSLEQLKDLIDGSSRCRKCGPPVCELPDPDEGLEFTRGRDHGDETHTVVRSKASDFGYK